MKIILQKIIAESGYSSRRRAEELIKLGQVKINGRLALPGDQADPIKDKITINNKLISSAPKKIYLKLNKPAGYTCTNRAFKNERNIFDLVRLPIRLFAVGRLDKNSRGLVLLTNDGGLTQHLAHPKFEHDKVYEVRVRETVVNPALVIKRLTSGIDIGEGDGIAKAKQVDYLQNNLFVITLNEGKKRQIRRMFQALGLGLNDLKRVKLAGLDLGDLPEGSWRYLNEKEITNLKI